MSAPTTDPFGLTGAVLDGRFAVERAVAKGGFGVVYRGTHLSLRRPIALKVLFCPPGLDAHKRQLFFDGFAQEAQTIAALEHPAVVRVIDFGVSEMPDGGEAPWMVLEWVEGVSLERFLRARRDQPMTPSQALELLRPVFQALSFAHDQQVAHRDIKPSNIMLVQRVGVSGASLEGQVHVKLLDFGVAKLMSPDESVGSGETQTHAAVLAFSLPYASPEQKAAMKTGPWTDVHALGLIMTEALTGSTPYPGVDRLEVEQRITAAVRPTPALFGVDVGAWEPVIARAVSLRSPDRYQHAGVFYDALVESLHAAHPATQRVPTTTEPVDVWATVAASSTSTSAAPVVGSTAAAQVTPHTYTVPPASRSVPRERRPSRGAVAAVAFATLALSVVVGVGLRAAYSRAASSAAVTAVRAAPPPAAPAESPSPSVAVSEAPSPSVAVTETPSPGVAATETPSPGVAATETPSQGLAVTETPSPSVAPVVEPAAVEPSPEPSVAVAAVEPAAVAQPVDEGAAPSTAARRRATTPSTRQRAIRNRLRD